ncbi:MAG TPA: hypothetical protein VLS96_11470 [Nodosilinea sp.]|nr:hypothetical protein [Nodosilinea sp.]
MELVLLVLCITLAWITSAVVDSLPHLGNLLVPSPWLLGGGALVVVIALMRD